MTDEQEVAAIERRHDLALLDRLLAERARPVPPPPAPGPPAAIRGLLVALMLTIAEGVS